MIGQLLAGHYRILQVLGAGGFGQTYITEDLHLPGNPKCVLKHLKPASADPALLEMARKLFEKEAIVLQQLGNHDRIPRLLAYFEEQQEFYLVQEYIAGHPLSKELTNGTKWRDRQVIELLQEILEILVFIHGQGVIHRDIKPDNIMRRSSDRRLVLIDFGAIKQVRNQQVAHGQQTMTVAIGTPGYMPIEQASGNPRASSDIYALGRLAIQALTGVPPYDLAEDDRTGELKWEHLTIANPQLIAILQRMTRYHFKDRYLTAADALQAVNGLINGTVPQANTAVPTTQSRPDPIESRTTVVVSHPVATIPAGSAHSAPQQPSRGVFPLIAGIAAILAAAGSFAWFSGKLFDRRNFAADLKSDLCRMATPTDLPSTRVRSQPQRDAKIQTNLPRGTKVVYLAAQDAFIQIQMADRSTGWVYNNQISGCNLPTATPTPKPTPSQSIESPTPISTPKPKVKRQPVVVSPVVPEPTPSESASPSPTPIPIEVPTPSPTSTPTPIPIPVPSPTLTPFSAPRGGVNPSPTSSPTPVTVPTPTGEESPPEIKPSERSDRYNRSFDRRHRRNRSTDDNSPDGVEPKVW